MIVCLHRLYYNAIVKACLYLQSGKLGMPPLVKQNESSSSSDDSMSPPPLLQRHRESMSLSSKRQARETPSPNEMMFQGDQLSSSTSNDFDSDSDSDDDNKKIPAI